MTGMILNEWGSVILHFRISNLKLNSGYSVASAGLCFLKDEADLCVQSETTGVFNAALDIRANLLDAATVNDHASLSAIFV